MAASAAPPVTTSATTTDAPQDASSAIAAAPSDPAIRHPQQNADAPRDPLTPSSAPETTVEGAVYGAPVPSETHFASREELLIYVHEFTVHHGYAVVIQKSNVPRGQVWLRCDLGGSYRNSTTLTSETNNSARKRKCSSRLKNCPFQLYARRLPDARWLLKVQHASHNHDVAGDTEQLVAHPVARRMTLEQKQFVDELTEMGARPALIVERMKEKFPDKVPIKVQDIYNTRNYIRRERSAGRVPFAEIADQDEDAEDESEQVAKATVVVESVVPAQRCQQIANGGDDDKEVADVASRRRPPNSTLSLQQAAAMPVSAALMPAEPPSVAGIQEHRNADKHKHATATIAAAVATQERLQVLLRDANENFATWQPRTQKQFLFQLDVLLDKAKKGKKSEASSHLQTKSKQQTQQRNAVSTTTDSHSSDDARASPPAAPGSRFDSETTVLL